MGNNLPFVDMEHPYNPYPDGWEGDWMPYSEHALEYSPDDYERLKLPEHSHRFIEGWDPKMMQLRPSKPNFAIRAVSTVIGRKPKYHAILTTGMTPEDIYHREQILKD